MKVSMNTDKLLKFRFSVKYGEKNLFFILLTVPAVSLWKFSKVGETLTGLCPSVTLQKIRLFYLLIVTSKSFLANTMLSVLQRMPRKI